jgi:Fe-Mn family superoxide dismutase
VKNTRPDYVKAVVENCLNWQFASENYDRDAVWTYPNRAMAHHQ